MIMYLGRNSFFNNFLIKTRPIVFQILRIQALLFNNNNIYLKSNIQCT